MKLIVATCQFPVDASIEANRAHIERQMRLARRRGADVAHFSECCLGGYAGNEVKSFTGYPWERLERATRRIMALAKELRLWVILGSNHRLTGAHKPHNCLYVIDDRGRLVDRYDKMFCTGGNNQHDLRHYSPGSRFTVFTVRGIRCGLLICHDCRYPELYRVYKRLGVQVMFHSYHNGHATKAVLRRAKNIWGVIMTPIMQTYAANNYMWVSANNTSRRQSCWPSLFVTPDGIIAGRLKNHVAGVLISKVDTRASYYDGSALCRDRAMRGIYHSGTLVSDRRSRDRTAL